MLTTPVGALVVNNGYSSFIQQSSYAEAATYADGVITFPHYSVVIGNLMNQDMEATFDFKVILPKGDEIGTGIKQPLSTMDSLHKDVYDLSGRRVLDIKKLKSGIYIVNGKKVQVN